MRYGKAADRPLNLVCRLLGMNDLTKRLKKAYTQAKSKKLLGACPDYCKALVIEFPFMLFDIIDIASL